MIKGLIFPRQAKFCPQMCRNVMDSLRAESSYSLSCLCSQPPGRGAGGQGDRRGLEEQTSVHSPTPVGHPDSQEMLLRPLQVHPLRSP